MTDTTVKSTITVLGHELTREEALRLYADLGRALGVEKLVLPHEKFPAPNPGTPIDPYRQRWIGDGAVSCGLSSRIDSDNQQSVIDPAAKRWGGAGNGD